MAAALDAPVVTVIIPVLNGADFIGHAVESALASPGVPLEIIVVDDGSADDTTRIVEAFGPPVRLLRQDRQGAYCARNLAARDARGDWLAFLDADDDWMPEKLATQLAAVAGGADDLALVYTDRLNFGDLTRFAPRQSDSVRLWDGDIFEPLLLGNFITLSSVLMRKSWFDRLGGFAVEQRGVQDWDLWLRCAAAGGRVALCRDALTRYRLHPQQMSNALEQRAQDREAVLRRALELSRASGVQRQTVRRALSNVWMIGASQAEDTAPWLALRWYCRAAAHWPWRIDVYKGMIKCLIALV
ncbi:MAG TPA: glycosyltransferase [Vicinamibacterales bacterium]|jgi:glycosyltransferase involved in cell wall biosynthesis|nr:glycosyltransferase [Vicinamibacterales bacterium]